MDAVLPIAVLSVIIGALIVFIVFGNYFRKRKAEVQSIASTETVEPSRNHNQNQKQSVKTSKKSQSKSHSHSQAADKVRVYQTSFQ